MTYIFQQVLNALQLGSIYALIALGYTMVYGILTMINFAHGDLFMLGAFFCFLAATFLHLPFIPTLLIAMIGVAIVGVLIERFAYKPLRTSPACFGDHHCIRRRDISGKFHSGICTLSPIAYPRSIKTQPGLLEEYPFLLCNSSLLHSPSFSWYFWILSSEKPWLVWQCVQYPGINRLCL